MAAVIAVCLGIAWELGKYNSAPMALALLRREGWRQVGGGIMLALCGALVAGSVVASIGYLLESDRATNTAAMKRSTVYMALLSEMDAIDQQAALLSSVATTDARHSYRARAIESMAKADALRRRRSELVATLAGYEANPDTAVYSSFFGGLALLSDGSASTSTRYRYAAFALVAFVIEILSLSAYLIVRTPESSRSTRPGKSPSDKPRGRSTKSARKNTSKSVPKTDEDPSTDTRYNRVRDRVRAGALRPTIRAIKDAAVVSQNTASGYIKAMLKAGELQRRGRVMEVVRP
jgi:hypothetical protein